LFLESMSLNLVLERTRLNYARGLIVPKFRLRSTQDAPLSGQELGAGAWRGVAEPVEDPDRPPGGTNAKHS
jgi:hypothetical protein